MQRKELKPKKCKSCGGKFTPWSSLQTTCTMACALDYVGKDRAKKLEKANKDIKREFNRKDLAWQHEQCKTVFNKLRRLQEFKWFADRGLEPVCISCGKPKGGDIWCNGHFKTVGAQGGLRYDPKNCYLQHNRYCNKALSGNINGNKTTHGYLQGLRNRFGDEEAEKIIEYCETNTQTVKWNWQDLEEMRKGWNAEIRHLEKELRLL